MDYAKHYNSLINRAKNRNIQEYTENHHIIPKCIGGNNDLENLVRLTPEEHYVAHQLLVKIHPDKPALIHAAAMMVAKRPGNKLYGWLRRKLSNQAKQRKGIKNGRYGSTWITDGKTNKIIFSCEEIPENWHKGRIGKFGVPARTEPKITISECKVCKIKIQRVGRQSFELCEEHRKEIKKYTYLANFKKITDEEILKAIALHSSLHKAALSLGYKQGYSGNVKYRFDRLMAS